MPVAPDASGLVLEPFCVPLVALPLEVPLVSLMMEVSLEPLTVPLSLPVDPISSSEVMHPPAMNPAKANIAKTFFIVSFVKLKLFTAVNLTARPLYGNGAHS